MVKTTRAQRVALKRVFDKAVLDKGGNRLKPNAWGGYDDRKALSYREFRKLVLPSFDRTGCIMVPWCGMWLGIEADGFVHS